MKKTISIIGLFAALILLFFIFVASPSAILNRVQQWTAPEAPETVSFDSLNDSVIKDSDPRTKSTPQIKEAPPVSLPTSLNIEMPFYTQAPHADWDYPWQEACEEASVLLVANLYNNLNLGLEAYNTELLRLVDWEIETFGAYEHTTVEQTAHMIETQYNLETVTHKDPSFQDVQAILNQGHLIIAPFAGKLLGNPNFLNGGPVYHMSVIKGYDAEKNHVVVHDVGTRNGANYIYTWDTIQNSLHDWHDDDILLGERLILEVLPPHDS